MRIGLEQACQELLIEAQCVLSSEIKPSAIQVYQNNFLQQDIKGDITQIRDDEIPNFDILLAGFPCQPFSSAGTRQGFLDTRGTLFFEIERILKSKSPFGFILENVEGLVKHDHGRTLKTILEHLEDLGYNVTWKVLNAKDFGIPQDRKRIYITGTKNNPISLDFFPISYVKLSQILKIGFFNLYKGKVISKQELKKILDDLVKKGYLRYEHPKDIMEVINKNGKRVKKREYRTDLPKGYNIVVGKLSFEINKILDPHDITPTLVAIDMEKIVVVDGEGLRQLTIREGLRLFGFPEAYQINLPSRKAFDLLGNTVVVPIIREISKRILFHNLNRVIYQVKSCPKFKNFKLSNLLRINQESY